MHLTQITEVGALVLTEFLAQWENDTLYPASMMADLKAKVLEVMPDVREDLR